MTKLTSKRKEKPCNDDDSDDDGDDNDCDDGDD